MCSHRSPPDPTGSSSTTPLDGPIFPGSRPLSLPDTESTAYTTTLSSFLQQQLPLSLTSSTPRSPWLDRYSSASLPLPSQIPFSALPKIPDPETNGISNSASHINENNNMMRPSSLPDVAPGTGTFARPGSRSSPCTSSRSSSPSSARSVESVPTTISSVVTDVSSDKFTPAEPSSQLPTPCAAAPAPSHFHSQSRLSTHTSDLNPHPHFTHFQHAHQFPPSPTSSSSYPAPPDPPVILPADTAASSSLPQAPYIPFLSHAPPPPDSWIEVETTPNEYRLNIHLPGFAREGITLATRRRRILHVVADKWENGGGHFERRISFGYDADLIHVRAEFDGDMLRVVVPRRISPVVIHPPRPGPIGRA